MSAFVWEKTRGNPMHDPSHIYNDNIATVKQSNEH